MFQSHVIEINGIFIGAAVPTVDGFRFRAVHPQVDELDGFSWGTLDALRQATGFLFRTGRLQSVTSAPVAAQHATPRAEPPHRPSPAAPWTPR